MKTKTPQVLAGQITLLVVLLGLLTPGLVQARQVDAALESGTRVYLFHGDSYHRYKKTGQGYAADAKPKKLPGGWKNLPVSFNSGIDAALFYKPSGKNYFFKGDSYVRLQGVTVEPGYPKKLPGGWKGLPKSFHKDIDAAVFRGGHTYFFKGQNYVRFTGTTMDVGYPKKLPGGWDLKDFPDGVDAAAHVQSSKVSYFFKANDYVRLEDVKLRNKKRYPAKINWGWPDFPIFTPYFPLITSTQQGASIGRCSSASCEFVIGDFVELGKSNSSKLQTFKWNVDKTPSAHAVRWQVSSKPFPAFSKSAADLDFPGLIDSGVETINTNGSFQLNFIEMGFKYFFKEKERTGVNAASLPESFFLRVIPMKSPGSDNIAGFPSNTFPIYWPGQAPPPPDFEILEDENVISKPLFSAKIIDFVPPTFRDGNRWGCVTVAENDIEMPNSFVDNPYAVGKTICPEVYRGDSGKVETFDEFVDWALDSFDWVGDRYDDLFELATNVLMEISFCNAISDAAEDAGASGGSAVCQVVATAAVKIGAAALGIPPTIPSYNELVDKGIDYAVELAAEEIQSRTGVPCISVCEDLLQESFSELANGLKRASPQAACVDPSEAHKHGREPLCIPDEIIVKPAKGAETTLPYLSFKVRRRPQEPTPSFAGHPACSLYASIHFKKDIPAGRVCGKWNKCMEVEAQTITARLYDVEVISLDKNAEDDFLLDANLVFKARPFEFPWSRTLYRDSQWLPAGLFHPYGLDWMSMVTESTAHISVSGDCLAEDQEIIHKMEDSYNQSY